MMPPFVVFPTNRIAHFVEVSLYLFYLAQRVKLSTSAAIGATCDFGYNLMSAGVSKAYNGAVHASKKGKINIQAYAIASAIQAAVYKARSMRKTQNNRRKQGWIDLEGIKKRRTYN